MKDDCGHVVDIEDNGGCLVDVIDTL